jgi:hypothetical protein
MADRATAAPKCGWYGSGPACNGSCPAGYTQYQRWDSGCTTGSRAYCCRFEFDNLSVPRVTTLHSEIFGTGPICAGECPPGWTPGRRSSEGCLPGGTRITCYDEREYCLENGKRILCRTPNPVQTMAWPFTSKKKKVEIKFFSKARKVEWPPAGEAFVLNRGAKHTYKLECNVGEQICYGAWPYGADGRTSWGVGLDGTKGCHGCCRTCKKGDVNSTSLGN